MSNLPHRLILSTAKPEEVLAMWIAAGELVGALRALRDARRGSDLPGLARLLIGRGHARKRVIATIARAVAELDFPEHGAMVKQALEEQIPE